MGAGVSFIPSGKLCPREAVNLHLKTHRICFLLQYQHVSCSRTTNLREQRGSSKGLFQETAVGRVTSTSKSRLNSRMCSATWIPVQICPHPSHFRGVLDYPESTAPSVCDLQQTDRQLTHTGGVRMTSFLFWGGVLLCRIPPTTFNFWVPSPWSLPARKSTKQNFG